ncbi:MAG: hypothetical protein U0165_05790 [Polyangiaceae bacterium]
MIASLDSRRRTVIAAALLTALPGWLTGFVTKSVASVTLAGAARGDAVLGDPGAVWLIELLRLNARNIQAALSITPWAAIAFAYVALVTWTMVLASFVSEREDTSVVAFGASRVSSMSVVLAIWLLIRAAIVWLLAVFVGWLAPLIASSPNEKALTLTQAGFGLPFVVLFLLVRVPHDLSYAACVRHQEKGPSAIITGLSACRYEWRAALGAWVLRFGASALVLAVSTVFTVVLDIRSPWSMPLSMLAHHASLFALVWFRAAWLRDALMLVERFAPPSYTEE